MKELGDPMRRGADHGEAFGASIKDDLHNRTLRRMKATAATTHKRYGPDGEVVHEWTQRALAVSRVMQVWRDVIVRNRLLEDEASSPYLQRKHLVLKDDRLPTLARQHQLSDSVPYSVSDSDQRAPESRRASPCFSTGEDEGGA